MKLSASVLAVQYLLSQETETFVEDIAVFGIAERGSITTTLVGFNGEVLIPVLTSTLVEANVQESAKAVGIRIETPVKVLAGQLKEVLGEATMEDKLGEIFTEPTSYESVDVLAKWVDDQLNNPGDFKVEIYFAPCSEPVKEKAAPVAPTAKKSSGVDSRRTGCGREAIGSKITY
jgi:hypothetical protein